MGLQERRHATAPQDPVLDGDDHDVRPDDGGGHGAVREDPPAHRRRPAGGWKIDVPSLFLLAIGLTAVALGSWKEHSAAQIMLQVTLACVGCLTLIWIGEEQYERAIRYWCQGMFAATVTIPMLARRFVKTGLPRGPRRDWWKKTCEAAFFSFLTMMLVTAGGLVQAAVYGLATNIPTIAALSSGNTPRCPLHLRRPLQYPYCRDLSQRSALPPPKDPTD